MKLINNEEGALAIPARVLGDLSGKSDDKLSKQQLIPERQMVQNKHRISFPFLTHRHMYHLLPVYQKALQLLSL